MRIFLIINFLLVIYGQLSALNAIGSAVDDRINVVYARLSLKVNPAVRYIEGNVAFHFTLRDAQAGPIDFDLAAVLSVDSVKKGPEHLSFFRSGNTLIIEPDAASAGLDSLIIYYKGVPPLEGMGSFVTSFSPGGDEVMWTLSEPYGARDWWPCRQNLRDKIDSLDLFITVPVGFKTASNGVLKGVRSLGDVEEHHWKHRYPISTYLVAFAVARYEVYSDTVELREGALPVVNYVYPESKNSWMAQSPVLRRQIQYFDSLFIPYPFMGEKYGHAQFGWGGGMEHQTMSFMVNLETGLMAHELAHQWFGNYITCGSWQEIWLNEGFATYLTSLYNERFRPEIWTNYISGQKKYVLSQPGGSVFVYDTTNVDRIFDGRLTYSKGGMVLHMLRKEIGDAAFFDGTRSYLKDTSLAHDFATTEVLRKHFEMSSGRNLQRFIKQWIYLQGFPHLEFKWRSSESGFVSLSVKQSTSHSSVDNFELYLPVAFYFADGSRTVRVLHINEAEQHFMFYEKAEVLDVVPDEGNDFLVSTEVSGLSRGVPLREMLSIIPNPAGRRFEIVFKESAPAPEGIKLMDLAGREQAFSIGSESENGGIQLELPAALKCGYYIVRVMFKEEAVALPVVIVTE